MSASRRHSSGEDNILARLERDAKRGTAAKSWKSMNTTVAWCALASLAVIGLIAVLASLAKENMAAHDGPIVVEAKVPADRYADPDGGSGFAPLPAVGSPPRKSALIVDDPLPGSRLRSVETSRVPPMVMLKPVGPVPGKPVAMASKPAAAAAKSPASAPSKLAAAVAAKPAKPAAARPAPVRLAAKATPPKPAPVKVAAAPPVRVLAAAPAPRPKKAAPAPAAKPEASAMDSDVALLSAIIMHANRHAAERAQIEAQNCPTGKKCTASKTTD